MSQHPTNSSAKLFLLGLTIVALVLWVILLFVMFVLMP